MGFFRVSAGKGEPSEAISKGIKGEIWTKVNTETEEILGFTILSFTNRFSQKGLLKKIPVIAEFVRS